MSREIKFRAWGIKDKRMWWNVQDAYDTLHCHNYPDNREYCDCEEHNFRPCSFGQVLIDKDHTVMQFTGLKDKNDKEIYEGDVLSCKKYPCFGQNVIVRYGKGKMDDGCYTYIGFYLEEINGRQSGNEHWLDHLENFEIVGNIYENPGLIKKEA